MSGLFITLEGGEGAGKSTQARLLAENLRRLNHEVLLTREPGGSPGAEALRELLLFGAAPLSRRAQALGHMAARADHLDSAILPALERGVVVVCDRFHDSTLAYQGYGLGHGDPALLSFIDGLRRLLARDPDLTLLLDVPLELGRARMQARGGKADRYEAESEAFHHRVAEGFDAIASSASERVVRIDASPEPEVVSKEILSAVMKRLGV
ncbi:dTMP kinase [Kozakia baliensis]|uniref:Thymidylate kinase n=1 Tax=Kozakia baliensis TaxID=153496 RepID=A0A1D8UTP9_9PROT|nr:dTMP kinase [Kozakia baliensis]AOX17020.1 thymidylate kinase [Kozakia baliensis]GBR25195.1 thymidylate kinase [Kozakia baliensis NRIC 0488]GEL63923.1 thymidylate kinase [Kozakia baliensis]